MCIRDSHIPEELGREVLRHKDDPKAVREIGTEWAVAQSRELVEAGVPVLHYYPMGKACLLYTSRCV